MEWKCLPASHAALLCMCGWALLILYVWHWVDAAHSLHTGLGLVITSAAKFVIDSAAYTTYRDSTPVAASAPFLNMLAINTFVPAASGSPSPTPLHRP